MNAFSQVRFNEIPLSWSVGTETPGATSYFYPLPPIDCQELLAADQVSDLDKSTPLSHAVSRVIDKGIGNSGRWLNFKNGDRLWMMGIDGNGAKALGLVLTQFELPMGAKLTIYSEDRSGDIITLTQRNNNTEKIFATIPIQASRITVEYFEPFSVRGQGKFNIHSVSQSYRDFQTVASDSNERTACRENTQCFNEDYRQTIASTVLIGVDNVTKWCTGVMVNNTSRNGLPYILTSLRNLQGDPASWIFIYNYESKACYPTQNGVLRQYLSGARLVATSEESGVALLELFNFPEPDWKVYYSGWNHSRNTPTATFSTHHSRGEIKHISFDMDAPELIRVQNKDVWKVNHLELGMTEKGTSGAPLFNQDHELIGIFLGGNSSCDQQGFDYYVRISSIWELLFPFLDPINKRQERITGIYAAQKSIDEKSYEGGFSIYPNPSNGYITFQNNTAYPVDAILIYNHFGQLLDRINSPDFGLDLSHLPSGSYLLEFQTFDQRTFKKLIRL